MLLFIVRFNLHHNYNCSNLLPSALHQCVQHTCSWQLETSVESTFNVAEQRFNVLVWLIATSAGHRVSVRGAAAKTVDLREPSSADELTAGRSALAPTLEVAKPVGGVGAGAGTAIEEQ